MALWLTVVKETFIPITIIKGTKDAKDTESKSITTFAIHGRAYPSPLYVKLPIYSKPHEFLNLPISQEEVEPVVGEEGSSFLSLISIWFAPRVKHLSDSVH